MNCVRKAQGIIGSEEYDNAIARSIPEESAMYQRVCEKIENELDERTRKLAYEDCKLHMERAGLLAYMHGEYYTLGERIGRFGYSATPAARGGVKGRTAVGKTEKSATESTPKGYQRRGVKPVKKKRTVKPPPFPIGKKRR